MYRLMKIEWLKIKNYITFWILTALFVVLLPLFNLQLSQIKNGDNGLPAINNTFPAVYSFFGFWASFFVVFMAFLIVILITNEFRYRTNRQNILDGWTRLQYFHAKCLMVLMLAVATTLYFGILCIVFGGIYSNTGFAFWKQDIEKVGYFFVLCLNYYGFAMMLAFLLKRSGLSIGIFMMYVLIFENIAREYLNWQFKGSFAGTFLPTQVSDELLPFPLMRTSEITAGGATAPATQTYLIISVLYIVAYYIITRLRLMKSDW